jgi:hypothetical protein
MKMRGLLCVCVLAIVSTVFGAPPAVTEAPVELKPPVVMLPSFTVIPELTEADRQLFAAAVFPGELEPPNYAGLHSAGILMRSKHFRIPTSSGVDAMRALAAAPAGRELLRDIAMIPLRGNDSQERLPTVLRLLVADQGRSRELAWLACIFMLNPEGADYLGNQVRARLPHVTLLGVTHAVELVVGKTTSSRGVEEVTMIATPLQHRNTICSDTELEAIKARAGRIRAAYNL